MSYYQGPPGGYPPPQGQYGGQGYQGYGAPPPPPGGYPPSGGYPPPGYPPQGQYNQGGYAPPPQPPGGQGQPYGDHGYPPPPPQGGYYPPQGYGGYQSQATPQQYYDAEKDVAAIRKATKGWGTDENALINILARGKSAYQMEQLRKTFEAEVGKSLVHVIEKETSGWFEYGLRGLALGPLGFDVWLLHHACKGLGTNEDILTEVLVGRPNQEIEMLKAEYHRVYHHDLVHVIRGELSFKTERMFNMILAVSQMASKKVLILG